MSDPRAPYLDEVSRAIIAQLQEDGRRAYATIGKAVGLSEAAVRQRVQKLLDAGVMQIVAVTDPLQMGFARQALIGVVTDGAILAVGEALAADEPTSTTSSSPPARSTSSARPWPTDDDHLLEIITRIRAVAGVPAPRRSCT